MWTQRQLRRRRGGHLEIAGFDYVSRGHGVMGLMLAHLLAEFLRPTGVQFQDGIVELGVGFTMRGGGDFSHIRRK